MREADAERSQTWVSAVVLWGSGATASYVLQRLIDAASEPPIGAVLAQAHTPYYWRMALAALHGLVLAALSLGLPKAWRGALLYAAPIWIAALCLLTLVSMLAVP